MGLTTLPPSMSRLPRQCEILNISQLYRPPRPFRGTALLFFLFYFFYFCYMAYYKLTGTLEELAVMIFMVEEQER
jgi:hypothetical protein